MIFWQKWKYWKNQEKREKKAIKKKGNHSKYEGILSTIELSRCRFLVKTSSGRTDGCQNDEILSKSSLRVSKSRPRDESATSEK